MSRNRHTHVASRRLHQTSVRFELPEGARIRKPDPTVNVYELHFAKEGLVVSAYIEIETDDHPMQENEVLAS